MLIYTDCHLKTKKYFIDHLSKALGQLTCQYDKTMSTGDFNLPIDNKSLKIFLSTLDLERLIKEPTCFQSLNPTCINLVLTNKKELFKNTDVIVSALKSQLLKGNAKTKLHQDYSSFNIDHFQEYLDKDLKNNSITEYSLFQNVFLEILRKYAPIKKRY